MKESRATRTNRPYELVEYDFSWPGQFEELKLQLNEIFADSVVDIQHIGSTSIPGMLAKPVLDAVVVVKDLKTVPNLYPRFRSLGYECKGDFTDQNEEYFTFTSGGKRLLNVHVMQPGNPHIKEVLDFRNYMRANTEAMEEYRNIKIQLRDTYGIDDYNTYDEQKGTLMDGLKVRAKAWADDSQAPKY